MSESHEKYYAEQRRLGLHRYNWKGRFRFGSNYLGIYSYGHPRADARGRVAEHIIIWEQTHNKKLPHNFIVHHLNGIK